jgi:hypothetical protein
MELVTAKIRVLTLPDKPTFTVLLPEDTSWATVNRIVRQRYGQATSGGGFNHKYDHQWNYVGDDENF